jgi:Bromodomain
MEISDPPLPTPPSNPPTDNNTYDRLPSPPLGHSEDPLSASPVLSHQVVVDAFTSDVRDEPPSPPLPPPPAALTDHQLTAPPSPHTIDIPQADSSLQFDRPSSEPPIAMDIDENPPTTEMVNGHKVEGEYTAEDMFSGPAVESPEPTNEPSPPSPDPIQSGAPPSMVSGVEQASNLLSSSLDPPSQSPLQHPPPSTDTDVIMTDAPPFTAPKPFREPPSSTDEPPAKRLKTEFSTPSYDSSKKIPANQSKFLLALLRQVKKAKDAVPFREPVDPVKLNIPRYFEVIERPMDISTIERKLSGGAYPVVQAVVDDFNLMVENCVKFNGAENPITKMGKNLQATFEKGMKTLPAEQVSTL